MTIIIFVATILILTTTVWFVGKISTVKVCPICAGVSLTWLISLSGMYVGVLSIDDFRLPTAILMGGSVVGIAYKLEDNLRKNRSQLLWKTFFISFGIAFMYGLVLFNPTIVIISGLLSLTVTTLFIERGGVVTGKSDNSKTVDELVKKMEKCC